MGLKRTLVIAFSSIKGGVGKTTDVILLARFLAGAGLKVLLADSDLNNSLSFHFLDGEMLEKTLRLNFAAALADERNNLRDFAVRTKTEGVDLIASTPHLSDLRTISEKRLKRMLPALDGAYDVFIIDCHPTYDNIVLNALYAADYVITPAMKDMFSYNAVAFLSEVLARDVETLKNWYVTLNGFDAKFENAAAGIQADYLKLYREAGFPLTPASTWMPWTSAMRRVIDYRAKLTRTTGVVGALYHPALYNAIAELAECFFENLDKPGAF